MKQLDAPPEQVYGSASLSTQKLWDYLEHLANMHSQYHMTSHWPCYVPRICVTKFLAWNEIFQKVINIPGDIIEIGVSRGISFFSWCKFLEIYTPSDTSKKVVGFDSFEGLTDFSEADGVHCVACNKVEGGWSAAECEEEVVKLNELHNANNVVAKQRGILVKGRIQDTLDEFLTHTRPGTRISLLHIDVDLYEPVMFALDKLYPLVVPGGVVIGDEYSQVPWAGESKAFDDYARKNGHVFKWQKIPWSRDPSGFFVK